MRLLKKFSDSISLRSTKKLGFVALVIIIAAAIGVIAPSAKILALTAGPNTGGSFANGGANGDCTGVGGLWGNPANALDNDGAYATASVSVSKSQCLFLSGFNFSIPSTATINGVVVEIKRHTSVGNTIDNQIELEKGGVVGGTNKASASAWPTSDALASYGGSSDLWGLTLTPTDVNAANFGAAISVKTTTGTETASVDYMQITVSYTPANASPTITSASLNSTDCPSRCNTTTPRFNFSATDAETNDIRYEIQYDTSSTFTSGVTDSYNENNADGFISLFAGATTKDGQAFTGDGRYLDFAQFSIHASGSPPGNIHAEVYASTGTYGTNSNVTGSVLATSDNVVASSIGSIQRLVNFTFTGTNKIKLVNGTHYVLILNYDGGGDISNSISFGSDVSSPSHPGNHVYLNFNNSQWTADSTQDVPFYVYTGTADMVSGTNTGFTDTTSGDTDPFTTGDSITYAIQAGDALTRGSTYYYRVQAIDPTGSNTYSGWSTTQSFVVNSSPAAPTLIFPVGGVTPFTTQPIFQLRTSDADSDYVKYNIKIYGNTSEPTNCNNDSATDRLADISQVSSQTGWVYQNTQTSTAYTTSTDVSNSTIAFLDYLPTVTGYSALTAGNTYYWKARAIDPGGTGIDTTTWGPWSTCTSMNFTTATTELKIHGNVNIHGNTNIHP